MTKTILCERCGYDYADGDSHEAFATVFSAGLDVRADLHIECPECGDLIETEVRVIAPIDSVTEGDQ